MYVCRAKTPARLDQLLSHQRGEYSFTNATVMAGVEPSVGQRLPCARTLCARVLHSGIFTRCDSGTAAQYCCGICVCVVLTQFCAVLIFQTRFAVQID